jgi:hypothetical protein
MTKQIVYIESPFSGDIELNLAYLGACMLDCIERGEVPIASHGDLPRWLDDTDPKQRAIGIRIGFERAKVCDKSVVYEDFGRSEGMKLGKRVMFRLPNMSMVGYPFNSGGYFRYCAEFKNKM